MLNNANPTPATPDDAPGAKIIHVIKRWSPALFGVAAGAQLHGQSAGADVIDLIKNFGAPLAILLLCGAKLTQWIEQAVTWMAPRIEEASESFKAIADASREQLKVSSATAERIEEADELGRQERGDIADSLAEVRREIAAVLREMRALKKRFDYLCQRLTGEVVEAIVPHHDATP